MSFGSLAAVVLTVYLCRRLAKKPMAVSTVKLEQVSDEELQSPAPVPRHSKGKVPMRLESPIDISSDERSSERHPSPEVPVASKAKRHSEVTVTPKARRHPSPEVPFALKAKRRPSPEVPVTSEAEVPVTPEAEVPVTPEAEVPVTPKAKKRPSGSQSVAKASKTQRNLCGSYSCLFFLVDCPCFCLVCRTSQDLSTSAVAEDTVVEEDLSSPSKDAGGDAKARLM